MSGMKEVKETLAALAAGVAIATIAACGGAKSAKSPASVASPGADGGVPGVALGSPKDRIVALEQKISADMAKLALPQPPSPAVVPTMEQLSVKPSEDPQCKPAKTQVCTDSCMLADSICDNAKLICEIAKELGNDAWANDKCTSGNASCEAAHDKCCGCS